MTVAAWATARRHSTAGERTVTVWTHWEPSGGKIWRLRPFSLGDARPPSRHPADHWAGYPDPVLNRAAAFVALSAHHSGHVYSTIDCTFLRAGRQNPDDRLDDAVCDILGRSGDHGRAWLRSWR